MAQELQPLNSAATPAPVEQVDNGLKQRGMELLAQHVEMMSSANQYAQMICQTDMCPKEYRNKPADATAAIMRGAGLGFSPAESLEAFFVISGRVGMYARSMYAVALNVGCKMWEEEKTDTSVTWCGTRPGDNHVERVTWTLDRAKQAGYTKNARYGTNTVEMLRSKCQAELARMLAPGALMGLYSEQESTAFESKPVQATAVRADSPATTTTDETVAQAKGLMEKLNAKPAVEAQPTDDTDLVAQILQQITTAESRTQIKEIMGSLPADLSESGQADIKAMANSRWAEVPE